MASECQCPTNLIMLVYWKALMHCEVVSSACCSTGTSIETEKQWCPVPGVYHCTLYMRQMFVVHHVNVHKKRLSISPWLCCISSIQLINIIMIAIMKRAKSSMVVRSAGLTRRGTQTERFLKMSGMQYICQKKSSIWRLPGIWPMHSSWKWLSQAGKGIMGTLNKQIFIWQVLEEVKRWWTPGLTQPSSRHLRTN